MFWAYRRLECVLTKADDGLALLLTNMGDEVVRRQTVATAAEGFALSSEWFQAARSGHEMK